MSDVLFVSETEVMPELEMAKNEIAHYGYVVSFPVTYSKALQYLRGTTSNVVLINANNKKIEAYELCKEIKETFRGAIKAYVYIPDSSPNEGSKFGLVNAEVEDAKSITSIVDKMPSKSQRDYILDENVISVYGMHGGVGASFITILLAHTLNHHGHNSLVLESSNTRAIKKYLNLENKLSLLVRDKSKELDQAKDLDWFSGFLSRTSLIPKMSYLNLFPSSESKSDYLEQPSESLAKLAADVDRFIEDGKQRQRTADEINAYLFGIANSMKLVSKDLIGESFSLFDEVIQLGSKISKNIFFDISNDIYSPLNKQLLKLSNVIVLVFRDTTNIKEEYQEQKNFFKEKHNLKVVPVIAPPHYYYAKYEALKAEDWQEILGDVPMIYPYDPETVIRFIYDKEELNTKKKLFKFTERLLEECQISVGAEPSKKEGLLNFLYQK